MKSEPIDNLSDRMAGLSPAKRALLELRLKKKAPRTAGQQSIPRRSNRGPAPLSFAQQRLWFLDQLEPESSAYNQPKAIRMSGTLNVEALQKSLNAIVARHESLRTTFVSVDGNPVQVIGKCRSVELPVIDLTKGPDEGREAEIQRVIVERTQRPFDLSRDLMIRAALLRLGEQEHILLLVTHHIASDGWSSGILSREIATFYESFSSGGPAKMPELPIQYADFAVWQRQWLQGEVLESQVSYWKRQLGGSPPVVELPTDRPRPAVQTFRGARRSQVLPLKLAQTLKDLSQQEGVTLFMTLLAAFQTLLYRYTGQEDIVVGSPIAGRTRVETERMIGFFVNTLVLRTDLSGSPSFRELLKRVREVSLGAYAHQDLPFEKLVEELKPDRDLGHTPLFQVLFALQNAPRSAMELPGLTLSPVNIDSETAKFELSVYMLETQQGLVGTLEYNTDLFEDATINRMLKHLRILVEGIVSDPDRRICDLPILTEAEQRQLLVEWNSTKETYSEDSCLHRLFEAEVEQSPNAVAVQFEDRHLTYHELNQRANQLAHYLRKLGVGPEVLVGIYVERSLEMVVGMLGVLKAGGAYVPLDPAYPKERLAFMLEDSRAAVLLTQGQLAAELPEHKAEVVSLDIDWELLSQQRESNPGKSATARDLAYVIYTSGSTGKPKGVQISHRSLVNFLESMRQRPGLTGQDTVLAVTTLSFDIAALEIFLPLVVGGRVVVASREAASDGVLLSEKLSQCGATVMQATPATWRLLVESGWQGSEGLKILCGGEALSRELADQLLGRCCSLWNMYGPTETTIWSAVCRVEAGEGAVSIGRAIANTQIYILDSHLQPVPVGVPGELYIGGDGLARGYLNRPELTAEKFIRDPLSGEPTARLYRTGDQARYLPDGNIELVGRMDHQVKIRGFRIELGEIETALCQHPAVNRSVVVTREGGPGEKWLAAYVVPHGDSTPSVNELRRFLKEKLPDYMVPSAFAFLDALPLTPNGKIDRKALPVSDQARPALEKAFVAPRDSIELQLTKLWEEVLDIKPVGVRDNFFDLGGYSLLAVRLFNQIEKIFDRKLPLATLFRVPTIEQLANIFRGYESPATWSSLVPIQPNGSKTPFFCVHAHGGNVLNFNDLARCLDPDQPFYGLQAQGLDGAQPRHTQVEEMADHYINEIRALQPEGPYFLGGYCFGGKVAFEMAHRLHAQGQEVAMLAVIDGYAPGYPRLLPWFQRGVILRARYHFGNLKSLGPRGWLNYSLEKARIIRGRIERRAKKIISKFYLALGFPLPPALLEVQEKRRRRSSTYSRKIYPGKITVFSPSEGPESVYHDPHMGWEGLAAGGVEVYEVPGKFASIIVEPSVRVLARKLENCLDKAGAAGSNKQG